MSKFRCPACNNMLVDDGALFCKYCGAEAPGSALFTNGESYNSWRAKNIKSSADYAIRQIISDKKKGKLSKDSSNVINPTIQALGGIPSANPSKVISPSFTNDKPRKKFLLLRLIPLFVVLALLIAVGIYVYMEYFYCPVKYYTVKEFNKVLEKDLDIDNNAIIHRDEKDREILEARVGDAHIYFYLDQTDDSAHINEEMIEGIYEFSLNDDFDQLDGDYEYAINPDWSYLLVNAVIIENDRESYYYGSMFLKDDIWYSVVTNSDSASARKDVNKVLDKMGLPKPPQT